VKSVLITGSEGYIGQHLGKVFFESGIRSIGLDKKIKNGCNSSLEYILCDLSSSTLGDFDEEIDCLVHLAGVSQVNASRADYQRNTIDVATNLLNSHVCKSLKKIVLLSSNKIDDQSCYGQSKIVVERKFEKFCTQNKIALTILRSSIVFGKGMNSNLIKWTRLIKQYPVPRIPENSSAVAMIGIRDLCKAIVECCVNPVTDNKKYYLSDGHCYRINDIEKRARTIANKTEKGLVIPRAIIFLMAKTGDVLGKAGFPLPINSGSFNMLLENKYENHENFYRDTNLIPQQDFLSELPHILDIQ